MKATNCVEFKVVIEEREYLFFCDQGSPLGHVWDSLHQMREVILQQMKAQDAKPEEEECQKKDSESSPEA